MKKILYATLIFSFLPCALFGLSDRYVVEQNLTSLVQGSLDTMFGENNFIARVQVQMTDSKYVVKYTEQSSPKINKTAKKTENVYLLPGIPAIKNIAPDAFNKLPFDSVTSFSEPKIRRMLIYIAANRSYPKSQARKAERSIKEIVGFVEGRDTFSMEFIRFYKDPNKQADTITIVPGKEALLTYQNLFFLILSVLLIALIIIYIIYQQRVIDKMSEKGDDSSGNINVSPNVEVLSGGGGTGGESKISIQHETIKQYFDFINLENIDDFVFLLKKQSLNPQYLAYIISFLKSDISAKLLNAFPVNVQSKIALELIDQKLGNKALLEKLEKKFKTDLECFIGGTKKFSKIIENLSSNEKKELVKAVQKNSPAQYKKLRPHVLLFDDLMLLEDDEIKQVLSDFNPEQIAKALVNVDQTIFDFILNSVPASAKDMISQFLKLKSTDIGAKETELNQDLIVKKLKRFIDIGQIDISAKTEGVT